MDDKLHVLSFMLFVQVYFFFRRFGARRSENAPFRPPISDEK